MAPERPNAARRLLLAAAVLAACAAAVVGIRHAGRAARGDGAAFDLARDRVEIDVVGTAAELWALWRGRGIQDRTIVHLGSFLHFVASDAASPPPVSHRNYLWLALHEKLARSVVSVLPPEEFRQRFGIGWGRPLDDVRDPASPSRTITARLPQVGEPVVLAVDASWFRAGDPRALVTGIRASGLRVALMTVSFALDNPDVTDAERGELEEFLDAMAPHAEIRPLLQGEAAPRAR